MNARHLRAILAFAVVLLLCGIPQAKAQTLEGNLRAWWLMGENATVAGNTIQSIPDHSGNSVAAGALGSPQRVAGNAFAPYSFPDSFASTTGAAGRYLVPHHESHNIAGAESFSISLWARSDGNGGEFDKLFQRNESNRFYQLETDNRGGIIWNVRAGGNAEISSRNIFAGNTDWHNLVATHNEDTGRIAFFIDGVADDGNGGRFGSDLDSSDVGDMGSVSDLAIGSEENGSNPFEGEIDDFRIYDVALTGADAMAIYNNGAGDFNVIPEPGSFTLAALGLLSLGLIRWRRRRRK